MSIRNQLIALQKKTFLSLKQEILDQRRFEEKRISNYRKKYLQEVENFEKISSKKELFKDIADARIVFCGDFHTLSRSQYTAVKILEFLAQKGKKVKLALEMIPRMYESIANDFVEGAYDEGTFLDLIHYQKIWGFPWQHYKPIFDVAKENQFEILGVNTSDGGYQPFSVRDKHASKAIFRAVESDPDVVVFCLYGDLHIADVNIPSLTRRYFEKNKIETPPMVTVFQNSDAIYWKLQEENKVYDVDVVKIKKDKYCVLSSTPWIKWQSYQSWMEDHISIMDSNESQSWDVHYAPDYFHVVLEYAEQIRTFLKLEAFEDESLKVFSSLDFEMVDIINKHIVEAEKTINPIMQDLIDIEMIENRCLFLPNIPMIYLQDVSPNRIAQKASQWVATQVSDEFTVYDQKFSLMEHFYRIAMIECIGFFGSKIINPKQKTSHLKDFYRFLKRIKGKKLSSREKIRRVVATFVLYHQKFVREEDGDVLKLQVEKLLSNLDNQALFLSARAVGRLIGDHLYTQVLAEHISIAFLQKMYGAFSPHSSAMGVFHELLTKFKDHSVLDQKSKDAFF